MMSIEAQFNGDGDEPGSRLENKSSQARAFPPGPTEMGEGVWQNYLFYRRFFKDPLSYVTRWMETYGDVWHFMIGDNHNYSVANPMSFTSSSCANRNVLSRDPPIPARRAAWLVSWAKGW